MSIPAVNKWQRMVQDFHREMGQPAPDKPEILGNDRSVLRLNLIEEEVNELEDALLGGYMHDAIDAICDLLYVTIGTAVEMGIDVAPFMREVHRSNMAKAGGPRREDGKILKPKGWKPPDIAGVFRERYGEEP